MIEPTNQKGRRHPEQERPVDKLLKVSRLENYAALDVKTVTCSLRELEVAVRKNRATCKSKMRLFFPGVLGDQPSPAGSYRHSGNIVELSAIAVDYDGGTLPVGRAAEFCENSGIAALFYETPSSTQDKPRWRGVFPLSEPIPKEQHYELVARVNGLLGGILAKESFTDVQAYYYGHVKGQPMPQTILVDEVGYLNEAAHLTTIAIGKKEQRVDDQKSDPFPMVRSSAAISEQQINYLLSFVPADEYVVWVEVGMHVKDLLGEFGFHTFEYWSQGSPNYGGTAETLTWPPGFPPRSIRVRP